MVRKPVIASTLGLLALLLLALPPVAVAEPLPGECATGNCGTPNNNGGGGCGCGGGSILVNNTDIGDTYSTSDDYDADGFEDDFDNCPFIANRDQADKDGDGVGDVCDNCASVGNKDQMDTEGDGIGDVCDADADNDGLQGGADNCALVPNKDQADTDKDGKGDACDDDIDADGLANAVDKCPFDAAADAVCDADHDKDGVKDNVDNCIAIYNPDQGDADKDAQGDACDSDADNDGIPNAKDNCKLVKNPDQKDADKDGIGDTCDPVFCFVAAKNPAAACLDPKSTFAVTAGPRVKATTGSAIDLSLYVNRENVAVKYAWVVSKQAPDADDSVANPRGSLSKSEVFEAHFNEGARPQFNPSEPGTYTLKVMADLVNPDPLFPQVGHAESSVDIVVTGESTNSSCAMSHVPSTKGSAALFGLAGLAVLALRRRRRA